MIYLRTSKAAPSVEDTVRTRCLRHHTLRAETLALKTSVSLSMGRSLVVSSVSLLRNFQIPNSISPFNREIQSLPLSLGSNSRHRSLCTKAVLNEFSNQRKYPKVGAQSTGPIPSSQLLQVVETAAKTGAEVCFVSLSV